MFSFAVLISGMLSCHYSGCYHPISFDCPARQSGYSLTSSYSFSLFCPRQHHISAHLAVVALDGNANNLIGDAELAVQLSSEKKETENLRETIKLLKEQIESLNSQILRLDSNLKDKDIIIELLKERRKE